MAASIARARIEQAMNSLPPKVQKFLTSHIRKGENFELKAELNSEYRDRRKEAVKRVIANMTVGKDVSGLFADVLKCMQTDDLELKKLVYLYLMNYAKSQPELVILAVNSFVKDVDDSNPLIRALAVRTMGCLRADRIVDYLMEPLRKTLKDVDPYVRKTAAVCVAKMFDLKPQLTVDNGFVAMLQDLLSDPNPMVVANAVASLREIQQNPRNKQNVFSVNAVVLHKLLAALNECTEWGQIFILESLAEYKPSDGQDATNIVERVLPRLSHANGSVVLSAIRVLLVYLDFLHGSAGAPELTKQVIKKMSPPLVTLLSSGPEMTFVALRNISIILQKQPTVLSSEIRVFFCKYNDPQYVKMEKLDIMMRLTTEENVDPVLTELKEYANEVDVAFVRKAIRAVGTCALLIKPAAERSVTVLLDLLKTRIEHIVQEAVIVLKDIFRCYPGQYVSMVPSICEYAELIDEEEARAAFLWIIGEHVPQINNAPELLNAFAVSFKEEDLQVQLQLMTSAIRCYLARPECQPMVHQILQLATASDNPDLRDRGYVYWRLLSSGADVRSILVQCPSIKYESIGEVSPGLLSELVLNLGNISAVWHKTTNAIVCAQEWGADDSDEEDVPGQTNLTGDMGVQNPAPQMQVVGDLLDMGIDMTMTLGGNTSTNPASASAAPNLLDLLSTSPPLPSTAGNMMAQSTSPSTGATGEVLVEQSVGNGLEVAGFFKITSADSRTWQLTFKNYLSTEINDFAIQLNKNTLGLVPAIPLGSLLTVVHPNGSVTIELPLNCTPTMASPTGTTLQAAIKSRAGISYFNCQIPSSWV